MRQLLAAALIVVTFGVGSAAAASIQYGLYAKQTQLQLGTVDLTVDPGLATYTFTLLDEAIRAVWGDTDAAILGVAFNSLIHIDPSAIAVVNPTVSYIVRDGGSDHFDYDIWNVDLLPLASRSLTVSIAGLPVATDIENFTDNNPLIQQILKIDTSFGVGIYNSQRQGMWAYAQPSAVSEFIPPISLLLLAACCVHRRHFAWPR